MHLYLLPRLPGPVQIGLPGLLPGGLHPALRRRTLIPVPGALVILGNAPPRREREPDRVLSWRVTAFCASEQNLDIFNLMRRDAGPHDKEPCDHRARIFPLSRPQRSSFPFLPDVA